MALKPCKECRKEISTEAKVCPNCGKRNPTAPAMSVSRAVLIVIGIIVAFAFLKAVGSGGGIETSAASAPAPAKPVDPAAARDARVASVLGDAKAMCTPSRAKIQQGIAAHPTWEDEQLANVLCKRVAIGMTATQVRASWGAPESVNRTTMANTIHEQWVYGDNYVYVDDGIVSAVQTSR